MKICHCLFWKQKNKVAAIYKGNSGINILKFKGGIFAPYTEDYWELWKDYSGYCTGDLTDFCFIYDKPMEFPDEYKKLLCDRENNIWTVEKIHRVSELLGISNSIDICNENNEYIMTVANANSKKNKVILFSENINISDTAIKEEVPNKFTSFIQYYIDKGKGE